MPLALLVLVPAASVLHLVPSDAGSGHDADDTCEPGVRPSIDLDPSVETYGYFTPPDDRMDYYAVDVPTTGRVFVELTPGPALPPGLPLPDHDLAILDPNCMLVAESSHPGNAIEKAQAFQPVGTYVVVQVHIPEGSVTRSSTNSNMYCDPLCIMIGYRVAVGG